MSKYEEIVALRQELKRPSVFQHNQIQLRMLLWHITIRSSHAFKRLMDRIREPNLPPCDIFIPSNIVVRESSSRTKTTTKRKGAKRGN